ncbi:PepSY domain-containing protein [Rheinheimera sp. MMS21-TC3]|uniref:PepSY domain-containing protein n=1 Tax=Rheinheimera sp. MMS21-TC3 TaxID=3072790 RepID=UPI0028C4B4FE|nr:PepSY domain-containing protein [Rheinheimera sp. MMS21-TC3]WNO59926.1 PepSY domain-containing protein [Rheinheimera sp. MMS21-TC3]
MKIKYLIALVFSAALLNGCGVADNPTVCTSDPQSEWLDQDKFQASLLASGYKINEFKVTKGNCYEIYGTDKNNSKVEIYFNPVDGSIVKQESH